MPDGTDTRKVRRGGKIDDRALDRILAAVELRPDDRDALRNSLNRAWRWYEAAGDKRAKDRVRRLGALDKVARRLLSLLGDEDTRAFVFAHLPIEESPPSAVEHLISATDRAIQSIHTDRGAPPFRAPWADASRAEWLVGTKLPKIFEHHFGEKAGQSHLLTDEARGGPYTRFREAVIAEFKIPGRGGGLYKPESSMKALTLERARAGTGRTRRKPRRN